METLKEIIFAAQNKKANRKVEKANKQAKYER